MYDRVTLILNKQLKKNNQNKEQTNKIQQINNPIIQTTETNTETNKNTEIFPFSEPKSFIGCDDLGPFILRGGALQLMKEFWKGGNNFIEEIRDKILEDEYKNVEWYIKNRRYSKNGSSDDNNNSSNNNQQQQNQAQRRANHILGPFGRMPINSVFFSQLSVDGSCPRDILHMNIPSMRNGMECEIEDNGDENEELKLFQDDEKEDENDEDDNNKSQMKKDSNKQIKSQSQVKQSQQSDSSKTNNHISNQQTLNLLQVLQKLPNFTFNGAETVNYRQQKDEDEDLAEKNDFLAKRWGKFWEELRIVDKSMNFLMHKYEVYKQNEWNLLKMYSQSAFQQNQMQSKYSSVSLPTLQQIFQSTQFQSSQQLQNLYQFSDLPKIRWIPYPWASPIVISSRNALTSPSKLRMLQQIQQSQIQSQIQQQQQQSSSSQFTIPSLLYQSQSQTQQLSPAQLSPTSLQIQSQSSSSLYYTLPLFSKLSVEEQNRKVAIMQLLNEMEQFIIQQYKNINEFNIQQPNQTSSSSSSFSSSSSNKQQNRLSQSLDPISPHVQLNPLIQQQSSSSSSSSIQRRSSLQQSSSQTHQSLSSQSSALSASLQYQQKLLWNILYVIYHSQTGYRYNIHPCTTQDFIMHGLSIQNTMLYFMKTAVDEWAKRRLSEEILERKKIGDSNFNGNYEINQNQMDNLNKQQQDNQKEIKQKLMEKDDDIKQNESIQAENEDESNANKNKKGKKQKRNAPKKKKKKESQIISIKDEDLEYQQKQEVQIAKQDEKEENLIESKQKQMNKDNQQLQQQEIDNQSSPNLNNQSYNHYLKYEFAPTSSGYKPQGYISILSQVPLLNRFTPIERPIEVDFGLQRKMNENGIMKKENNIEDKENENLNIINSLMEKDNENRIGDEKQKENNYYNEKQFHASKIEERDFKDVLKEIKNQHKENKQNQTISASSTFPPVRVTSALLFQLQKEFDDIINWLMYDYKYRKIVLRLNAIKQAQKEFQNEISQQDRIEQQLKNQIIKNKIEKEQQIENKTKRGRKPGKLKSKQKDSENEIINQNELNEEQNDYQKSQQEQDQIHDEEEKVNYLSTSFKPHIYDLFLGKYDEIQINDKFNNNEDQFERLNYDNYYRKDVEDSQKSSSLLQNLHILSDSSHENRKRVARLPSTVKDIMKVKYEDMKLGMQNKKQEQLEIVNQNIIKKDKVLQVNQALQLNKEIQIVQQIQKEIEDEKNKQKQEFQQKRKQYSWMNIGGQRYEIQQDKQLSKPNKLTSRIQQINQRQSQYQSQQIHDNSYLYLKNVESLKKYYPEKYQEATEQSNKQEENNSNQFDKQLQLSQLISQSSQSQQSSQLLSNNLSQLLEKESEINQLQQTITPQHSNSHNKLNSPSSHTHSHTHIHQSSSQYASDSYQYPHHYYYDDRRVMQNKAEFRENLLKKKEILLQRQIQNPFSLLPYVNAQLELNQYEQQGKQDEQDKQNDNERQQKEKQQKPKQKQTQIKQQVIPNISNQNTPNRDIYINRTKIPQISIYKSPFLLELSRQQVEQKRRGESLIEAMIAADDGLDMIEQIEKKAVLSVIEKEKEKMKRDKNEQDKLQVNNKNKINIQKDVDISQKNNKKLNNISLSQPSSIEYKQADPGNIPFPSNIIALFLQQRRELNQQQQKQDLKQQTKQSLIKENLKHSFIKPSFSKNNLHFTSSEDLARQLIRIRFGINQQSQFDNKDIQQYQLQQNNLSSKQNIIQKPNQSQIQIKQSLHNQKIINMMKFGQKIKQDQIEQQRIKEIWDQKQLKKILNNRGQKKKKIKVKFIPYHYSKNQKDSNDINKNENEDENSDQNQQNDENEDDNQINNNNSSQTLQSHKFSLPPLTQSLIDRQLEMNKIETKLEQMNIQHQQKNIQLLMKIDGENENDKDKGGGAIVVRDQDHRASYIRKRLTPSELVLLNLTSDVKDVTSNMKFTFNYNFYSYIQSYFSSFSPTQQQYLSNQPNQAHYLSQFKQPINSNTNIIASAGRIRRQTLLYYSAREFREGFRRMIYREKFLHRRMDMIIEAADRQFQQTKKIIEKGKFYAYGSRTGTRSRSFNENVLLDNENKVQLPLIIRRPPRRRVTKDDTNVEEENQVEMVKEKEVDNEDEIRKEKIIDNSKDEQKQDEMNKGNEMLQKLRNRSKIKSTNENTEIKSKSQQKKPKQELKQDKNQQKSQRLNENSKKRKRLNESPESGKVSDPTQS